MTFANAHLSRRNHSDASCQPACAPIYAVVCAPRSPDRHGFELAMQVGRHTLWPTHRIRCFLLSQTKGKLPQSAH